MTIPEGIWGISPTGTTITGTYWSYIDYTVNILASGTCFGIITGTAEIERVAQVQAYEGQWFVKGNDNNILVADVEMMPIRRNMRAREYGSGYIKVGYEHPLHFRAPATINGTVTWIYDSGNIRCVGMVLYGDYVFTRNMWGKVIRINRKTEEVLAFSGSDEAIYNTSFTVIDAEHVVVYVNDTWKMANFADMSLTTICSVPHSSYYYPHWAVIKDVLCIGLVYEIGYGVPSPSWTSRWVGNWMFNIWTGEQLFGRISPHAPADAYVNDTIFTDLVVDKSFYWVMSTTSENNGTWPEVVGPEPARMYKLTPYPDTSGGGPIQDFTYDVKMTKLYYNGSYGDLEVNDIAYNPEDKLIYITGYYYGGEEPISTAYSYIAVMSPDNLSYTIIYSVSVPIFRPPWPAGEVGQIFRSRDKLYVTLSQGSSSNPALPDRMFDIRHLSTPLWTLPLYTNFGSWDGSSQHADINDRIWVMGNAYLGDQTMLYAYNIQTGVREIEIDTGIPEAWGDRYYYQTDGEYRAILPADECVLIFVHNTYQYAYQGRPQIDAQNTYIYTVT